MNWAKCIDMHCLKRKRRKGLLRQVISDRKLPSKSFNNFKTRLRYDIVSHPAPGSSKYWSFFSTTGCLHKQREVNIPAVGMLYIGTQSHFTKFWCTIAHLLSPCSFKDFMESWGLGEGEMHGLDWRLTNSRIRKIC